MRWVPGVLTDPPGRAPRGPAMGISGLQRRCNQRLRLPGNKKRTHSRGSHPPLTEPEQRTSSAGLTAQRPALTQGGELGSWAENTRGPRHLGSEGRVSKMRADVDKRTVHFQDQAW